MTVLGAAKMSILVPCAVLSLAAAAGGQVHRCIDGGRTTYTDRECSGDPGEEVAIASVMPVSLNVRDEAAAYAQTLPVTLGMSPRGVFDTLGRPFKTVATLEGRTLVEYWVYRGVGGTTRVAFQEGRVTRITTR